MHVRTAYYGIPGQYLPNHACVIATKGDIVLAMWSKDSKIEYITWKFNERTGDCCWGHYFDNIVSAAEDFNGRK